MATVVNVDNFVRAETDRMFAELQKDAGGVNTWTHSRRPTAIAHQTVIRMNRDTLYSFAVVDISEGATLSLPDAGERYLSAMVVDRDHYINGLFHEPGDYHLTVREFDTPWVGIGIRILVDPSDETDVATVNGLQDQLGLTARAARPFVLPDYDTESLDSTRAAILELAKGLGSAIAGSERPSFGRREEVDPVHHLIGSAAGWGGLPPGEAIYVGAFPGLPADGEYELTVRDVPVDGLVDLRLQRAGVLRAERARRVQRQQHHGGPERRRFDHGPFRRLRRRPTELHPDHGGLELPRPPVSPEAGGHARGLDVSRAPADVGSSDASGVAGAPPACRSASSTPRGSPVSAVLRLDAAADKGSHGVDDTRRVDSRRAEQLLGRTRSRHVPDGELGDPRGLVEAADRFEDGVPEPALGPVVLDRDDASCRHRGSA
jgi:hypothetical protein